MRKLQRMWYILALILTLSIRHLLDADADQRVAVFFYHTWSNYYGWTLSRIIAEYLLEIWSGHVRLPYIRLRIFTDHWYIICLSDWLGSAAALKSQAKMSVTSELNQILVEPYIIDVVYCLSVPLNLYDTDENTELIEKICKVQRSLCTIWADPCVIPFFFCAYNFHYVNTSWYTRDDQQFVRHV